MEIDFTTALIARPFHAQSLLSRYGKEYLPEMRYCCRCCLFVCFCSFSFSYDPALQQFYCINFHLSARKRQQPPQKNRVVYIMTLQSQNLIILLCCLGLPSFLPDTTCMKRASSKSQRAHERYVDRCPVACSVCLSRFGSWITCAISSPVNW